MPVASQRNPLQRPGAPLEYPESTRRVARTGQAELVASQRSLQQCTARGIAPPAVARSGIRCSAAQSVATQRQRLHPGAVTASCRDAADAVRCGCRLGAADGCNWPQTAAESFRARRRRTECLVGHSCGTIVARCTVVVLPLGEQVSCTCCVCAAQRSLAPLTPIRPHVRFGTALIAHHRTGLIPAHICTGTKSTPHPHLHRD